MTIERKFVFGIDDIRAISFECVECGARTTVALGALGKIPKQCSHCNEPWSDIATPINETKPVTRASDDLIAALHNLKTISEKGIPARFRIWFEIDEPR